MGTSLTFFSLRVPSSRAHHALLLFGDHVDLTYCAVLAGCNLLSARDGAGGPFLEPSPTFGDRCDELGTGLGADRALVRSRRETETGGIISRGRLAGVFFQGILRILVEASVCTI
jgi:hypothetical protein